MKRIIILFCLLLIIHLSFDFSVLEAEDKNVYDFAVWLMQEEDYAAAITEFKRYLHFSSLEDIREHDAIFNVGFCYYKLDDFGKAINTWQVLSEDERKNENFYMVRYAIANAYFFAQNYNLALNYFITVADEPNIYQEKSSFMKFLSLLRENKVTVAKNELEKFITEFGEKGDSVEYGKKILPYVNNLLRIKKKNILQSVFLSSILPGAGQIYCGRYGDGIFSFLVNSFFGTIAYTAHRRGTSTEKTVYSAISIFFYIGNIYGAFSAAKNYNDEQNFILLKKIDEITPYDKLSIK